MATIGKLLLVFNVLNTTGNVCIPDAHYSSVYLIGILRKNFRGIIALLQNQTGWGFVDQLPTNFIFSLLSHLQYG
ncbi:MAG: hypothetical protein NTV58_17560 [Deltaproteobacteria bacterium]|nr:hypothetical protein [Deltaproteobacteria bacterium]